MGRLKGTKDLLLDGIENGTRAVQKVHQEIAARPFVVLESFEPVAKHAQAAKEIHQKLIGDTYDMIRLVSRVLGDAAGELIDRFEPD